MASKKQIVRFLHILAETMEIPPRQLAAAALEYASSVFDSADNEGDAQVVDNESLDDDRETVDTGLASVPRSRPNRRVRAISKTFPQPVLPAVPRSTPYTGPLHLCLDFGTAMSKACAWNKESDTPMPLRIGLAAGEPASSPYAINSSIFISRDGLAFVGQAAVNLAAATDPEHHQAFQSIKDILTVGPVTDLRDPVPDLFNPSDRSVSYKEIVALYLAFLTDSALLALQEEYGESSRNIPRSYTKPVFDPSRDEWATEILTECAVAGQVLADRFSGRWSRGIPLDAWRAAVAEAGATEPCSIAEGLILPEPVAAFASRVRNVFPEGHARHLMMVIDVGAGTTDFAMFARVDREGEVKLFRVKESVTTIRIAGNAIDDALLDYLMLQAGVAEGHSRRRAIRADLQREIRLIKEELFTRRTVTRQLINDMKIKATWKDFEECQAMIRLRDRMEEKFHEVLSAIDPSWLSFPTLEVFLTGGGASLNMVTRLAAERPVAVGEKTVTPVRVTKPPPWLEEECEDVIDFYPQLAVCIGGACHGAGKTLLGVEKEFEVFRGDVPAAQWEMGGFRDGQ